jgi:hypothetical protein
MFRSAPGAAAEFSSNNTTALAAACAAVRISKRFALTPEIGNIIYFIYLLRKSYTCENMHTEKKNIQKELIKLK